MHLLVEICRRRLGDHIVSLASVVTRACGKVKRRCPHVFAEATDGAPRACTPGTSSRADAEAAWQRAKSKERAGDQPPHPGIAAYHAAVAGASATPAADDLVVLVAKFPAPGRSKTRLAPLVGEQGAAAVARAMLADKLVELAEGRCSGVHRVLLFAPATAETDFRALLRSLGVEDRWRLVPMVQDRDLKDPNLGHKLAAGLRDARRWSAGGVVGVGAEMVIFLG